ncbi:M48 family metallopeptidase [Pseudorhodobacter sp.]|uniref:M48 metallopeptidase family protein n=1 Tax=Pseudorhodobacter sp. TaxID=1934400 RepID=UPI0026478978|nr:YgjP-like metallopeptidase domain-containing protein [Pseudorhodobacter sp.]MDN5788579.1 DUF45 domain-containing protein [Pseudorhodobacter sp.]
MVPLLYEGRLVEQQITGNVIDRWFEKISEGLTNSQKADLSPAHRLLLNRRLVEAPVDAIDYVITHELCHIAEPQHVTAFFDLLDRVMPDWERRKQRLERIMA